MSSDHLSKRQKTTTEDVEDMADAVDVKLIALERLPSLPKAAINEWYEQDGFVETADCTGLLPKVQECMDNCKFPCVFVAGPLGVGKSSAVYYCSVQAWKAGWLLVYIPRCDLWLQDCDHYPYRPYCYFFDAVLQGLTSPYLADNVKTRFYDVLIPPQGDSWLFMDASWLNENMKTLREVYRKVTILLREEQEVTVLLAFDEVQALFFDNLNNFHYKYNVEPFNLVRQWNHAYKRGCTLVTGEADSGFKELLPIADYGYRMWRMQPLSTDELMAWLRTPQCQFLNAYCWDVDAPYKYFGAKRPFIHLDVKKSYAKLMSTTGAIPGELMLLNEMASIRMNVNDAVVDMVVHRKLPDWAAFDELLAEYTLSRSSVYEDILGKYCTRHSLSVQYLWTRLYPLFLNTGYAVSSIGMEELLDTGLTYRISKCHVQPLNNAVANLFLQLSIRNVPKSDASYNIFLQLEKVVNSDDALVQDAAFARLFTSSHLSVSSLWYPIDLRFTFLDGRDEFKDLDTSQYITWDASCPFPLWKAYASSKKLVEYTSTRDQSVNLVYFGLEHVIFFRFTVASKLCAESEYFEMEQSILDEMTTCLGVTVSISADRRSLLGLNDDQYELHYAILAPINVDELNGDAKWRDKAGWMSIIGQPTLKECCRFPNIQTSVIAINRHTHMRALGSIDPSYAFKLSR
jgi:hypothetical protein